MIRKWVSRCEQFFMLDCTPPELKVRLASVHMEGKAYQWHHNFIKSRYDIFPSWPEYVGAISARFGELYDDPLSELVSLKQDGDSIEVYLDKFECALTRLSLPPSHALSIFLTNMNPHLALHARQFEVKTVTKAARIAKLHESALLCTPTRLNRAPFSPYQKPNAQPYYKSSSTTPLLPSPRLSDATKTQTQPFKSNFVSRAPTEKFPRKFSYEEMQERRSKGLCMFCEEPFTPGHQLKHKRAQIFLLECEEEDFDGEESVELLVEEGTKDVADKAPTISINAL